MKKLLLTTLIACAAFAIPVPAQAKLHTETVDYAARVSRL